ncbi:hypothetical protein EVAR_15074_1 [Eumeta japonica]|uniref:Uncharacterized protein n=1 Tax=Eumeta variegata TaxID=151549 RepID=A0A4C1YN94_EUMVA|nr:hypothetical protein EVAR_15074_1 [Eumeta japonica]
MNSDARTTRSCSDTRRAILKDDAGRPAPGGAVFATDKYGNLEESNQRRFPLTSSETKTPTGSPNVAFIIDPRISLGRCSCEKRDTHKNQVQRYPNSSPQVRSTATDQDIGPKRRKEEGAPAVSETRPLLPWPSPDNKLKKPKTDDDVAVARQYLTQFLALALGSAHLG